MQKKVIISVLVISVLFLSLSFASAFSFSELWNKLFVRTVSYSPANNNSLIAYYPLDNSTIDLAGSTGAGVPVGNPSYITGAVGDAIYLDGNQYISIPSKDFTSYSAFSVSLWANPDNSAPGGNIIYHGEGGEFSISYSNSAFSFNVKLNNGQWYSTGTTVSGSRWYYITAIYNKGSTISLYLDGLLVNQTSIVNAALINPGALFDSRIGAYGYKSQPIGLYKGVVDQVRLYNSALSQDEINELHSETSNGGGGGGCKATSWSCGSWSSCLNGSQSRSCLSNCNTTKTETQSCTVPVCYLDSDCGLPIQSLNFCLNSTTVLRNTTTFRCNNPGTANSSCSSLSYLNVTTICPTGYSCFNGTCIQNQTPVRTCQSFGYTYGGNVSLCTNSSIQYNLSSCYNQSRFCVDSDLGLNPYYNASDVISGSSTIYGPSCTNTGGGGGGGGGSSLDYCFNNITLIEKVCNYDNTTGTVNFTCPNGCSNGACVNDTTTNNLCQQFIDSQGGIIDQNISGYEFMSNYTSHYENSNSFNDLGNATVRNLNYYNPSKKRSISINIFSMDDESRLMESTDWYAEVLSEFKDDEAWQVGNIMGYDGEKWNQEQYYFAAGRWGNSYFFWPTRNSIIILDTYSDSDKSNALNDVSKFVNSLRDNKPEYVSMPVDVQNDLFAFAEKYFANCDSKIQESCYPSWEKRTEPVVCPEYGRQTESLVDNAGCAENKESQKTCSPGICSGCYVPRWFGARYSDKTCVPYGFRINYQTGSTSKIYEDKVIEEIINETGFDVSFEIKEDRYAYININGNIDLTNLSRGEIISFIISYDGQEFNGSAGESLVVYPGYHQIEVNYFNLNGTKVLSYSTQIEISRIVYSSNPSERYIEIINRYNYPAYCDLDGWVKPQKNKEGAELAQCQNNYECESNICSGGECVDVKSIAQQASGIKGLIVRVLCRLSNMFDGTGYEQCLADYS